MKKNKQKFNPEAITSWYSELKDLLHTYLVYKLGTEDTEQLIVLSLVETARVMASKNHQHPPLVVALSSVRHRARTAARKNRDPQMMLQQIKSAGHDISPTGNTQSPRPLDEATGAYRSPEAIAWIDHVFHLPNLERDVFVLREILGLSSRHVSLILKLPSVKIEARLHSTVAKLDQSMHSKETADLLQRLMEDDLATSEPLLSPTLRTQLQFHRPQEANSAQWLLEQITDWQRRKRRKRKSFVIAIPSTVLVLAGAALWVYQPWMYWMLPVQPVATPADVQSAYVQTLGFIPRVPGVVPAAFKYHYSTWQQNNINGSANASKAPYLYGYILRTTKGRTSGSMIQILEEKDTANDFNFLGQNNTDLSDTKVNGVTVSMSKSPTGLTAEFKAKGIHDVVMAHWVAGKPSLTKSQMIQLVRSMLIHPSVISTTPDYQVSNFNTLSSIEHNMTFHAIIPSTLPKRLQSSTLSVYGSVFKHGKQTFDQFQLNYVLQAANSNVSTQLTIAEEYGGITYPEGQAVSAQRDLHQAVTGATTIDMSGQQVFSGMQGNLLSWYDKKDGILFRVQDQPQGPSTSNSGEINTVRGVMKELIAQAQE